MSKICYSPEGNPEMWDKCPEGYTTEESWVAMREAEEKAAHDAAEAERLDPANLRASVLRNIDDLFSMAVSAITQSYPEEEATFAFSRQAEDVALYRRTNIVTPFLSTLAKTRMIPVEELIRKIEHRKEVHDGAMALAVGLRYYYRDAIVGLEEPTAQQLLDLDVSYKEVYEYLNNVEDH